MERETSILISMRDEFTSKARGLQTQVGKLSQEFETSSGKIAALKTRYEAFTQKYDKLSTNLIRSRSAVADATKEWKKNKDEINSIKLDKAKEEYNSITREMQEFQSAAKDTQKEIKQLQTEYSKADNTAKGGLLGGLAEAGMIKMAGDVGAKAASTFVNSAFGDDAGSMFSSMLSSAASGAAMGSMVGHPVIGAAIGGGIGLVSGAVDQMGRKDDYFKSAYGSEYERVKNNQENDLQYGIGIAAGRQIDQIAFNKMLGGKDIAKGYLDWVKDTANSTPFLYDDLKGMSKTLATYKYTPEEMQGELIRLGDTGANLGWSSQDMNMAATGLGRMKSSGKTSLEYVNLLLERGVDAIGYLGEEFGKTNGEIYEMISKGAIAGGDAAKIISEKMGEDNKGAMEEMAQTYNGRASTIEGLEREQQNAMGEGYINARGEAQQKQIDFLSGETGGKLQKGYSTIGEFKASVENERERLIRIYEAQAVNSSEYLAAEAEGNGAKAGEILMKAQITAENEFRKTEGFQLMLESEKSTLTAIREEMSDGWENFGYTSAKEFSKGFMSCESYLGLGNAKNFSVSLAGDTAVKGPENNPRYAPHRTGLQRVPYDGYPALLHEGERVQTKHEAETKARPPIDITITGNHFGSGGNDIANEVARVVLENIEKALEVVE